MFAPPSGVGGLHPDHLGTSTFLTDYNGNAYQFFLNLPFGETMAEQLGSNYYNTPYKFNGKELDEETGLYYYGARYYDPRVSIWLSVDPMAEKFPNSSPYNYCLGNPINLIDPDGRYPFPILIYNSKLGMYGGYNFTQSASHLLSLVSGVSERTIQNVTIQERAPGQYRPFYSASSGGGGITLGLNSDQANITYTENYFEDNQNAYDGHGYGQDIKAWLDISAHEVGHLPQIDKEGSLTSYLGEFIKQYAGAAGHNGASYEKDAEKGTTEFRNFNKFVDKTYGKDALINVMKATEKTDGYKGSELYKIKKIDKFWKEYEKSAKKME